MLRRLFNIAPWMASGTLVLGGCASMWQDVPRQSDGQPKVVLDASWYLESPSTDLVQRLTQERQAHIQRVLDQRERGEVGVTVGQIAKTRADKGGTNMPPESNRSQLVLNSGGAASTKTPTSPEMPTTESGKLSIKLKGGDEYVR
jgi:hypothetical protein